MSKLSGNISPITFIDRLVKKNELGQPFTLMDHQREVLRLAFPFDDDGKLSYDTVIYSCVKKSGKTTLNGALTLAWGFTQEAPNEILILANDLEQTLARVFRTMEGIIQHNPELRREAEVQSKTIYLANGTTITAISGDYAGAAGSNHGFVSYDELWAYSRNRAAGRTVAVENPRGWRIAKEKPSRKIDAIVALSMASVAAMAHRDEVQSRVARGFNASVHVVPTIKPIPGPLFIGQMLEVPTTVVAQADRGPIHVIATFVSAETSLKNHLENVVGPWLARNTPWIFQNRQLIIGVCEDIDPQSKVGFTEILRTVLRGTWTPSMQPWAIRRDGLLALFGKAQPFTMKPALP